MTDAGWHVHDHFVVMPDAANHAFLEAAIRHWLAAAEHEGVGASQSGQDARSYRDARTAVAYASKGWFKPAKGASQSPGDILAAFIAGEADAAERWRELEDLLIQRRVVTRGAGGCLKKNALLRIANVESSETVTSS
ncbi:hypothetical protein [Arenivirga flava]|uniref:Uncharacterized protein n=1 Tax=Arenivirga flava TaxID=1930060 RepID=A0AA37UN42_9MICO|nr:hypothetical protein [Arenivirga flava]GMA26790.1 hypothetical protein GCM10025874_00430 [Arenivirga flava]GMA29905.1 hypothetical protein GCM10025874_31580 [Arenivirga flava]GMA29966.1 hypothetical protein GCM10025874_32190 [Arenivirga flava]